VSEVFKSFLGPLCWHTKYYLQIHTHTHILTLSKCVDGVIRRVVCNYNKVFSVRGSGFHSDSFLHVSMETTDLSSRQGHVDEVSVRVIPAHEHTFC